MDDYHLDMGIRFTPEKASLDELDKTVDKFKEAFKISDDDVEKLRKQMSDFAERKSTMQEFGKMLQSYRSVMGAADYNDSTTQELIQAMEDLAGSNEMLKEEYEKLTGSENSGLFSQKGMDVFIGNLKTQVINKLSNIAKSLLSGIANVFKEAWQELGDMVNQSFLTNSTYRNNAFTYGMSASESYGFEQAKSMMGLSEDDLYYMNDYQQEKFREIMTKYAERYEELYDSGFFEDYLDYQIEMQEFKQDMEMEIIEFFMDNKDTIKQFMELVMSAMEFLVDTVGAILDFFTGDQTSDKEKLNEIGGILDTYVSNNNVSNTTNNLHMDGNYTFNGTTDSQKQFYTDMLSSSMVEAKKAFE